MGTGPRHTAIWRPTLRTSPDKGHTKEEARAKGHRSWDQTRPPRAALLQVLQEPGPGCFGYFPRRASHTAGNRSCTQARTLMHTCSRLGPGQRPPDPAHLTALPVTPGGGTAGTEQVGQPGSALAPTRRFSCSTEQNCPRFRPDPTPRGLCDLSKLPHLCEGHFPSL